MAAVQTTMTENMAKAEAADIARRANEDSEQAGTKSDMEMKHAIIAQLQAMSDQIAQLNDRVTALTAQLTPSPAAGKAKPAKAKVSNQPPNPAVAH
jgi:Tfp pilus assembly protein PilO